MLTKIFRMVTTEMKRQRQ